MLPTRAAECFQGGWKWLEDHRELEVFVEDLSFWVVIRASMLLLG
jgi:hypothetical protein